MVEGSSVRPDNRISFTDQVMFLGQRATGQEAVVQIVWIYEHPIDFAELRRFHRDLGHGLMGRRIETSPLPFGRHRWVSWPGPQKPLETAAQRPRAELSDWVDERAQLPVDPEWGPGWHIGVLPMTDGATAVSLVASHCVVDGGGFLLTIADTVKGKTRDFGYPPPASRTRREALVADLADTARGVPEIGRTLLTAVKQGIRRRKEFTGGAPAVAQAPAALDDADANVVVPAASVYVDLEQWDRRAAALGGNSHSLLAAFAAKLGEHLGRRRASDGAVTLNVPISTRGEGDTGANVVLLTNISLDPAELTTDLSGTRAAIKAALTTLREKPDETLELLPLTPFVPKFAVRRGADAVFSFSADLPVSYSNLGDLDPAMGSPDGTPAEYTMLRGVDRHVTRGFLEKRPGLLTIVGGRIGGKVSMTIVGYQAGADNTKEQLRALAARTLAEFDLTGVIE